ncbi:MAG: hypothetical protein K8R16_07245, partial [Anaerolineales bacterium]|nr:hypothetical protein [Anaerolineales bacterium]
IGLKITLTDAPLKYKTIDFTQKIISNQELIIQSQLTAITLKNIETHQHTGLSYYNRNNNQSMFLENGLNDIDFRLFNPKEVSTKLQLFLNEPSQIKLRILFEPTLETGTTLSYGYRRCHKNYVFFTYEELEEAIKEERISNLVMIKERKVGECFEITMPTDNLKITFEFPTGYPIKNVSPIVMRRDEINVAETERIKELLLKEDDPFSKTVKLSINIPEPRLTYSYFLLYEPPKSKEIK